MIKTEYIKVGTPNRTGRKLKGIKAIVLHWVASPQATPEQVRDYLMKETTNSYHFIIGMDGGGYKLMPTNEKAVHCGHIQYTPEATGFFSPATCPVYIHSDETPHYDSPNNWTISIALCHPDWSGYFTYDTLSSLKKLLVELCKYYNLNPYEDIWTHHEIVGEYKDCPRWFSNNPEDLFDLKNEVSMELAEKGVQ